MRFVTVDRFVAVSAPAILALTALALFSSAPAGAQQYGETPDAATMRQMYAEGVDFASFHANATRRRALWDANWDRSDPAEVFVERAAALAGSYRILVVAVDSCSDSVNTIPYIARLVERAGNLELAIVSPDVGELLMEAYRTPDGRGATPTVAILNEDFEVVGTWIERPSPLQDWWIGHPEIGLTERARRKQGWYDWDEGLTTYEEIVALLEVADARR